MTPTSPQPADGPRNGTDAGLGRVLPFRRRGRVPPPLAAQHADADPAGDFAAFEEDRDEPIDYHRRMLMNIVAVLVVTLLVTAGVWIADTIAALQRDQDCILQGRSNCLPITLPAPKRR